MKVRNASFTAFVDQFTSNTYAMVITSDPSLRTYPGAAAASFPLTFRIDSRACVLLCLGCVICVVANCSGGRDVTQHPGGSKAL